MRRGLIVPLCVFAAGCAVSAPNLWDYDATCQSDTDCALVHVAGNCGYSCDRWGALNAEAASEFDDAQARYLEHHRCPRHGLVGCPPDDTLPTARCDVGTCVVDSTP